MANGENLAASGNKNPLAAFALAPYGVGFQGQDKGEQVILLLRAHIITLFGSVIITTVMCLAPFVISALGRAAGLNISGFLAAGQVFWLFVVWYLFTFGFAFFRFLYWYYNVYILTNERIVDLDLRGILEREISFTTLNHIEDVSPKTIGIFETFFNYGSVQIETAAERPEFKFENVPKPDIVADRILDEVRVTESGRGGASAN